MISEILFSLLFMSILEVATNIRLVNASGTIYIRADGSIDPPTANITTVDNISYTFTGNIYDSIIVERDNILINGANYTLQGPGTGPGYTKGIAFSGRTNVTVKNMEIKVFYMGVHLYGTSNAIISRNNITNCEYGVYASKATNNTISTNNIINNEYHGILVEYSSNNNISGNTIIGSDLGFGLSDSVNVLLEENVIENNTCGFSFSGFELRHFAHSIDTSNLVNGKPFYYLENQKDLAINPVTYPQVGYLVLINCTNATIQGLTLTSNGQGLLVVNSNVSRIIGNNVTDNGEGVALFQSSLNSLDNNRIENNTFEGIALVSSSDNNTIHGNYIADCSWGVALLDSIDNRFYHNDFIDNTQQVWIESSSYANVWDDGYPSGGNYWSDHNPLDIYSGSYQNETGRDKIGDIPYVIDENNTDRYPLIYPYGYVPSADLNDDETVNILDAIILATAFGSKPGDPNWNPYADINQDGRVNILDAIILAGHFGETV